jgi:uncharacterized protein DUF4384
MRPGDVTLTALVLLTLAPAGLSQNSADSSKMSAREIFYSAPKAKKIAQRPPAPPTPIPTPTPAPAPPAPGPLDVAKNTPPTPPAPPPTPSDPSQLEVAGNKPPKPPAPTPGPEPMDNPDFIHATLVDPPRLGLRCSVLKRVGASDLFEVDPEVVFRSGDRIRLRVTANDDGYLYVILRGSSGVWKPLFPAKGVEGGSNRVIGGRSYEIPQGHVFTFDDQPGEEKLFVIVSRTPVDDLESLIYNLGSGTPAKTPEKSPSADKLLLAENRININDSLVNRLRLAHARDLIIEKVDDNSPSTAYGQETAVYAVSAVSDTDSRVVVDLTLTHR